MARRMTTTCLRLLIKHRSTLAIPLLSLLVFGSSCAVSMKMQGNRFQSSEVYGKSALQLGGSYLGQSNVELTPDITLYAPNSQAPNIGPTHVFTVDAGVSIGERVEVQYKIPDIATGKVQIFGESKQKATDGNISAALIGSIGGLKDTEEDTGITGQRYKNSLDRKVYGLQFVAGYRPSSILNFYTGPFYEYGKYNGTYDVIGVSSVGYSGSARNHGAVLGLELGTPENTLITEAVWNQTTNASSRRSFWLGGLSYAHVF